MSEQDTQQGAEPFASEAAKPADKAKGSGIEKTLDDIAEIAALASSVAQQYKVQTDLVKQQAKAEWVLSVRSLTLATAILVCFGAGLIMLWGSILALIGMAMFQLLNSVLAAVAILIVLQVLALIWCWRSMRYLFKQVGLKQTLNQLSQLFSTNQFTKQNTDTAKSD
ncbi:hypothetical protein [Rheinheimera sp. MMS21-TC3]|uniref:hypothetical protein n=1 Tax=Rheinheimera sp. MMS21-TC3 TaxID=3072790 RepID=UPI0028C4380E|nr:hypothetical protein [Rheinheimera sp. MMS21-TC3]WNO61601.1 hypothetical protein RDV63_11785 [Rheinheimera sp. MMS21-TC3]